MVAAPDLATTPETRRGCWSRPCSCWAWCPASVFSKPVFCAARTPSPLWRKPSVDSSFCQLCGKSSGVLLLCCCCCWSSSSSSSFFNYNETKGTCSASRWSTAKTKEESSATSNTLFSSTCPTTAASLASPPTSFQQPPLRCSRWCSRASLPCSSLVPSPRDSKSNASSSSASSGRSSSSIQVDHPLISSLVFSSLRSLLTRSSISSSFSFDEINNNSRTLDLGWRMARSDGCLGLRRSRFQLLLAFLLLSLLLSFFSFFSLTLSSNIGGIVIHTSAGVGALVLAISKQHQNIASQRLCSLIWSERSRTSFRSVGP